MHMPLIHPATLRPDAALIMRAAHEMACREFARTVCFVAGVQVRHPCPHERGRLYAEAAAKIDRRSLRIPTSRSYAAELQRALSDYWHRARVMSERAIEDAARAAAKRPAPMFKEAA